MARVLGPRLDQLDERGDKYAAEIHRSIKKVVSETAPSVHSIDDLIFMRSKWNNIASTKLQQHLYDAWIAAAGDTYQQLVKVSERMDQSPREQLLASIFIPKVVSRLAELFLTSALNKIFSIGELVWNTAVKQMTIGLQNGESIPEIRKRIMQVADISGPRAEAIARTQVIGAMNAGSFAEMKATGLTARKEWIATEDRRTRPSHTHVDGEWADIDDKFIVGGYAMAYPHDPTGPDQEVINCRCTLGWDIPDEEFIEDDNDQLAASATQAFHLPGRHDQKDHGRKGLRGLSAGKSLKITHGLVHKKHDNGSIVAVNKNGDKHVLWEDGKYHLRKKDAGGLWQTEKTAIKSKAYKEINDFAPDWHEPAHDGDEKPREPDVADAPIIAVPDIVAPEPIKEPSPVVQDASSVGKSIKITHGLVHKKHAPGTTIAVNDDGTKQVVWDGAKYNLQSKQDNGQWQTDETAIKSKAYVAINAYDSSWHEPGPANDVVDAPTPEPTPTPRVAPVPAPTPTPTPEPIAPPVSEPAPAPVSTPVSSGDAPTPAIGAMRNAYANGFTVDKQLTDGNSGALVELLTLSDGSQVVRKTEIGVDGKKGVLEGNLTRREYLAGLVVNAVGFNDLTTAQIDNNTVITTFIPGDTGGGAMTKAYSPSDSNAKKSSKYNKEAARQMNLPGAKEIGLLDFLVDNQDRHALNWIVPDGNKVKPIDQATVNFVPPKKMNYTGKLVGTLPSSPFTQHWIAPVGGPGNDIVSTNPKFTQAELASVRTKLEGIKSQFNEPGESQWYDAVLDRLSLVEAGVTK